jgi:DNA-binding transcriptional LysR family regulator
MNLLNSDIYYVLAVEKAGSVTLAAQKVGIQQAGLSRAIQRVEERLGNKIFLRDSRGVRPTPFGMRFFRAAEKEHERWRDILAELKDQESEIHGRVRIGCHLAIALNYFPPILADLTLLHPGLDCDLQIAPSRRVCELVEKGDLEFGLVVNASRLPRLVFQKTGFEETILYSKDPKSNFKAILYNPEMFSIQNLLKKFADVRTVSLPSYDLIAGTLLHDPQLAGLLPSGVAKRYPLLQEGSSVLEKLSIHLIYREDLPKTKVNQTVIEKIKEV